MDELKKGDVVKLKSGGPEMTVTDVANDDFGVMTVWCCWFDKTDVKTGTFPIESVVKW